MWELTRTVTRFEIHRVMNWWIWLILKIQWLELWPLMFATLLIINKTLTLTKTHVYDHFMTATDATLAKSTLVSSTLSHSVGSCENISFGKLSHFCILASNSGIFPPSSRCEKMKFEALNLKSTTRVMKSHNFGSEARDFELTWVKNERETAHVHLLLWLIAIFVT